MKTTTKTIAVLTALLLAGFAAAAIAEDATPTAVEPGWGPGWRHEQMAKAWEKGDMPGPMMMMMRGFGPGARPALGADGRIDTSQLPPWCPLKQAQDPATK